MKEIQGKLVLVLVSGRFELAKVRVIGSRLWFSSSKLKKTSKFHAIKNGKINWTNCKGLR